MNDNKARRIATMSVLAGVLCAGVSFPAAVLAQTSQTATTDPADASIKADVSKALSNKRFRNVTVAVQGGEVTLAGTVDVYAEKEDAENKAHHRKNVMGVKNLITVDGPTVEDATLSAKLGTKLAFDRVDYGTTTFNAITVGVRNGVVTLGGVAYGPMDKDSAHSLVANYPGVKDVVDNIEVAPPSPMDDRIRLAEARAIYGYPSLFKYSIDPAKPIRITVVNGNVTLSGLVDTQADKDTANVVANSVSGVFTVTNNLQAARGASSSAK